MNVNMLSGFVVEEKEQMKLRKIPGKQDTVITFTIAVSKDHPVKPNEESAYFLPVVAWNKVAEYCAAQLEKGMYIEIEGYTRTGRREVKGIERVVYKDGRTLDSLSIPFVEVNARWIKIMS